MGSVSRSSGGAGGRPSVGKGSVSPSTYGFQPVVPKLDPGFFFTRNRS